MRIGIFTDAYEPAVNGISIVASVTKRDLEALGHEVIMFAPGDGIRGMRKMEDGVYRFPAVSGKFFLYEDALISLFFPPSEVKQIVALKLDVIHTLTPTMLGLLGLYTAKKYDIKLVQHYCTDLVSYAYYYPRSLPYAVVATMMSLPVMPHIEKEHLRSIVASLKPNLRPREWYRNFTATLLPLGYNPSDHIIAVSDKVAKSLRENGITPPITVIPTGVDSMNIDPEEAKKARKHFGFTAKDKIILSVGRVAKEKNLDLLIHTMTELSDRVSNAKLLIVGDFDYRVVLEALTTELGLDDRIIFAGKIPHDSLGPVYGLADVFVFPSLTDTQGLVVHEAAISGLPVVMIDKDVTEVVIEGVNGFYAENTPDDFATKLEIILTDDKLAEKMGKNGIKIASEFTEMKQTKKLVEIYESL